jgi:CheY-like chemotaxis protein
MILETIIADDDEMVVFLHKIAAAESGLCQQPVIAYNGSQALDFIQKNPEAPFLILLDINMPVMDGWEFLDAVQQLNMPSVFVVMVTSSVDSRDRKKALKYAQVIDYFEKPLSVDACVRIKNQVAGLL